MKLKQTHSIEKAAVKSGFSCATGYRINKHSRHPSEKTKVKRARRRPDPLAGIFEEQVVPMLEKCPNLRAVSVYEEIMRLNPQLEPGVRRTLERRVRDWRAQHGPQQEVIFRQRQEPGRMGISDFTDMNRIGVTIGGCKFDHKLYHFRLAWSGFTHVDVVQGGESFAALGQGLQDALWILGGAPRECRTDSLSAAFRNLSKDDGEDLTESYRQLCEHYGMQATRNNRGVAHENGAIEGPHGHLKRAIEDALALRGSKDFETLDEYRDLIAQITGNINLRHSKKIEAEREVLQTLPGRRTTDYKETNVRITRSSGFVLRKVFYTVPSRLIGHRLGVRLYADRVELYLGSRHQLTLPRGHHHSSSRHWCAHVVNYHHVIHSLRRKPMALMSWVYRDQLFPHEAYRHCFEVALERTPPRQACRLAVQLLSLAHDHNCEARLAQQIEQCLRQGTLPDVLEMQKQFAVQHGTMPQLHVESSTLASYASLLQQGAES